MAYTRVLMQQGQPIRPQLQHSGQRGPDGPSSASPGSGSVSSGRDVGPCGYWILTAPHTGTTCWSPDHSASRCYRRLVDLHCERSGSDAIPSHWPSRLRQGTARPIQLYPPRLGPFPTAQAGPCVSSLGACVVSSLGASNVLCVGAAATASSVQAFVTGSCTTSATAPLSFTIDSGASRCFFRDYTALTPQHTHVTVALADPSVGPVVAHYTTTLLCPAAPSGVLICYYTPSFSRNLFDPEGRPVGFPAWLRKLKHYLGSRLENDIPLSEHAAGELKAPPTPAPLGDDASADDQAVYAQRRTELRRWAAHDNATILAITALLPPTEQEHFAQEETAHALMKFVIARYSTPVT
ncbi:unnamed protein product, partial [Closterium sp. NIES-54]